MAAWGCACRGSEASSADKGAARSNSGESMARPSRLEEDQPANMACVVFDCLEKAGSVGAMQDHYSLPIQRCHCLCCSRLGAPLIECLCRQPEAVGLTLLLSRPSPIACSVCFWGDYAHSACRCSIPVLRNVPHPPKVSAAAHSINATKEFGGLGACGSHVIEVGRRFLPVHQVVGAACRP